MTPSLKERLERLGPIRDVDQVPYGSPVVLSLRRGPSPENLKAVETALALAKRGLSLLRAKRAVEEMLEKGRAVILVPKVENEMTLADELSKAGCVVASIAQRHVDVAELRKRLGLTQEQFALSYGLDLDAVRNWEHQRRTPDPAAQSLLRVASASAAFIAWVSIATTSDGVPFGANRPYQTMTSKPGTVSATAGRSGSEGQRVGAVSPIARSLREPISDSTGPPRLSKGTNQGTAPDEEPIDDVANAGYPPRSAKG